MELIPAIDLLDGKVVRLHQGKYDEVTVYDDDPVAMARRFEEAGATGSVRDEDSIRALFPHTFGRPVLKLGDGTGPPDRRALKVGVVLSGGQAPGRSAPNRAIRGQWNWT